MCIVTGNRGAGGSIPPLGTNYPLLESMVCVDLAKGWVAVALE